MSTLAMNGSNGGSEIKPILPALNYASQLVNHQTHQPEESHSLVNSAGPSFHGLHSLHSPSSASLLHSHSHPHPHPQVHSPFYNQHYHNQHFHSPQTQIIGGQPYVPYSHETLPPLQFYTKNYTHDTNTVPYHTPLSSIPAISNSTIRTSVSESISGDTSTSSTPAPRMASTSSTRPIECVRNEESSPSPASSDNEKGNIDYSSIISYTISPSLKRKRRSNSGASSSVSKEEEPLPQLPCELCGKVFNKPYNLKSHMKSHSTEKPYNCSVCNKKFARSHDKKRHELLHKGEKNFRCEGVLKNGGKWGCGKTFARSDALSRHFRTETGWLCIKPLMDEAAQAESTEN